MEENNPLAHWVDGEIPKALNSLTFDGLKMLVNVKKQKMSNETISTDTANLTPVTAESAKAKIKLQLTLAELSIQAVQDKADGLVFNEDNLPDINETITSIKAIQKKIDEAHKEGKKPYKEGGDAWDAAKNGLKELLAPTLLGIERKHTQLCQEVEKRKREAKAKEEKEKAIKEGMDNNIMAYSQKIADCKTTEQLLDVERLINLEKTRKDKYGDFTEEMITRLNELTPLVTAQKQVVRELKGLDTAEAEAIATGNDEKLQEILEKKEEIGGKIQENKVKVQETATNQATRSYGGYSGGYKTVFPEVKTKRRSWKTELISPETAVKHDLSLLRIELNPETVKARMETLKTEGKLKEGTAEEFIENGVKYFLDKSYS
jgi:hypothetical protein